MHLSMTPRFSDGTFDVPSPDPDALLRWFVITPFGHSVFVENEVKAQGLRKTYDALGYYGSSIYSEEIEHGEETIPF